MSYEETFGENESYNYREHTMHRIRLKYQQQKKGIQDTLVMKGLWKRKARLIVEHQKGTPILLLHLFDLRTHQKETFEFDPEIDGLGSMTLEHMLTYMNREKECTQQKIMDTVTA